MQVENKRSAPRNQGTSSEFVRQSQFRRSNNPWLAADERQFWHPDDGKDDKYVKRIIQNKRWVLRALILHPKRTAATAVEIASYQGMKARTVERTLARLKAQGFWTVARTVIVRDRSGRRIFRKERIIRALHPEKLRPVNVAVTEVQCGGDTSSQEFKNPRKDLFSGGGGKSSISLRTRRKPDDDGRRRKSFPSQESYFERAKRVLLSQGKDPGEVDLGLGKIEARRKQTPKSANYYLDSFRTWEYEELDRTDTSQASSAPQPTYEDVHRHLSDWILDVEEVLYRNWLPGHFREMLLRKPTEIHDALAMQEPIFLDDLQRELRAHDAKIFALLKSYTPKEMLDEIQRESEAVILFHPAEELAQVYAARVFETYGVPRLRCRFN